MARIDLGLRERVTIRGRVLDPLGAPIAGVTVEGRAVPIERPDLPGEDVDSPFTVRAETDSNGEYVLPGFSPPPIYHAAGFLLGVCNEVGMEHVDVCVSDARFEVANATRVILMTEALSNAAAPLAEVLRALPASVEFPVRRPGIDASKVKLYSSQSNDILEVDVVADPRHGAVMVDTFVSLEERTGGERTTRRVEGDKVWLCGLIRSQAAPGVSMICGRFGFGDALMLTPALRGRKELLPANPDLILDRRARTRAAPSTPKDALFDIDDELRSMG